VEGCNVVAILSMADMVCLDCKWYIILLGIGMCLTPSTWKVQLDEMTKCSRNDTILFSAYPIHGSASEENNSGADA